MLSPAILVALSAALCGSRAQGTRDRGNQLSTGAACSLSSAATRISPACRPEDRTVLS